jgi:hypothetical protein
MEGEKSDKRKQYRESNKEQIRAYRKNYNAINWEKICEYKKKYTEKNREEINHKAYVYRIKKKIKQIDNELSKIKSELIINENLIDSYD